MDLTRHPKASGSLRRQPQLGLRAPSGWLRKIRQAPSRRAWPVAMVRPRPVPPVREPVRKRWGPEVCSTAGRSDGNPRPWSRTRTTGPSTSTSRGGAPCRRALPARLARTRSTRRGSVATTASTATRTRSSWSPDRTPGHRAHLALLGLHGRRPGVQPGHLQDLLHLGIALVSARKSFSDRGTHLGFRVTRSGRGLLVRPQRTAMPARIAYGVSGSLRDGPRWWVGCLSRRSRRPGQPGSEG
jgi:hypothetical protein